MAGSNNYKILVSAEIDTAEIQRQLTQFSRTARINVDSGSVRQASKDVGLLGVKWADAGKKFLAWKIIGDTVSGVERGITQMITSVYELDTALTEFNKVTDLSEQQLDKFIDKSYKAGESLAKTGTEIIKSSTEFAKSGFDENQSLELGKIALLYGNIADEEISAGQAATFLVSQMKAFGIGAENAIEIVDQINEVSNKFNVSSSDLSGAIPKIAATMSQAGNSMSETLALITAGTEMMPNQAGRISRGLRSVTLNLQGMNDEGEKDVELTYKMNEAFGKLGIDLENKTTGQIKSTFQILKELSEVFPTLDADTRNYYAALIGGKTQVDVVNSVLGNFNSALSANEVALNSSGSAMRENEKYMQSMKAKLNTLKSTFEDFSRKTLNSDFVKSLIDAATGAIKFIDSIGGIPTVLTIISGVMLTKNIPAIAKFGTSIFELVGNFMELRLGGASLEVLLKSLGITATATQLAIGGWAIAIAAAGVAAVVAIEHFNVTLEEQKEIVASLSEDYTKIESDLKSLESQLQANADKLKELNAIPTKTYQQADEINNLRLANKEIQTRIDLLQREREDKNRELTAATKTEFEKDFSQQGEKGSLYDTQKRTAGGYTYETQAMITEAKYTDELIRKVGELNAKKASGVDLSDAENAELEKTSAELTTIGIKYSDFASREGIAVDDEDRQSWADMVETIAEVLGLGEDVVSQAPDINSAIKPDVEPIIDYQDELYNLSDRMAVLSSAETELADTGYLTADTLQALSDNNLLQYLSEVDGQATISGDALYNMGEDAKLAAIGQLQNAAAADLNALAEGRVNAVTPFAANAMSAAGNQAAGAAPQLVTMSSALAGVAAAASAAHQALAGKKMGSSEMGALNANINSVMKAYQGAIIGIGSISLGGGGGRGGRGGGGGGRKGGGGGGGSRGKSESEKIVEALNAEKKALEEQKKAIEKKKEIQDSALRGVIKLLDDEIDKLEKEQDLLEDPKIIGSYGQRIDSIKKEIDALDELYDAQNKAIENELDGIEEIQDAKNKAYDEQLEQLEAAHLLQIKPLEDELKNLEKIGDEKDRQLAIQKAEMELERVRNQRNIRVYREGQGFIWETDKEAISLAQENLDKLKFENKIYLIQKELEALNEAYDEKRTILQKEQDALNKSYNSQKEILEKQQKELDKAHEIRKESLEASQKALETSLKAEQEVLEESIKKLQGYKDKWSEVSKAQETAQDKIHAAQVLGAGWEKEVLDGRLSTLDTFKSNYIAIQNELIAKAEEIEAVSKRISDAQASANSSGSGSGGGGGGSSGGGSGSGGGSSGKPPRLTEAQWLANNPKPTLPAYGGQPDHIWKQIQDKYKGLLYAWERSKHFAGFAKGTNNFAGGALVVGENVAEQGREMIIPPKGSGIIPNPITENVMKFGKNPLTYLSNILKSPRFSVGNQSNAPTESYTFNGDISVSANNATEFISSIKSLAIQRTTKRT